MSLYLCSMYKYITFRKKYEIYFFNFMQSEKNVIDKFTKKKGCRRLIVHKIHAEKNVLNPREEQEIIDILQT